MLVDVYYKKRLDIPFITIVFFITCCIVTVPTYFDNNLYYVFANNSKPIYLWQVFSGAFEHSIFNNPPLLIHFLGNMVFLCVLGVLCERVMGNFKFFLLVISGMVIAPLQLYFTNLTGGISTNAGASGIVYTFPPIVLYILLILWEKNKTKLKREKMFYLILVLFGGMYIFISIFSPISTNSIHLIATIVGALYLMIWHKDIKLRVLNIIDSEKLYDYRLKTIDKMAILLSIILCIMMGTLLVINYTVGYKKLFFSIINNKTDYTIEEINANQNRVVINFSEPLSGGVNMTSHLYSEEPLSINVELMSDGLSCEIIFSRALVEGEDYGSFILDRNVSNTGKVLKDREVKFK